jgi:hypothetical protein
MTAQHALARNDVIRARRKRRSFRLCGVMDRKAASRASGERGRKRSRACEREPPSPDGYGGARAASIWFWMAKDDSVFREVRAA